jgi:demethylmenaquinone methyltransferase / 2-methoxy-6-polyprenyl-1,4-benzoquinol methylase
MSTGTTPPGARTEAEAARWVRAMFADVAPRYDLLNRVLSFQIDQLWRAHTVKRVKSYLDDPGAQILDLCCGTGDLLLALEKARGGPVWGSDFCHPMLTASQGKRARSPLFEADALELPLADGSLDLVTCAFGFRNFANYRKGISELHRVLRPGGTAAILEFSTPPNALFRAVYTFYSLHILPRIGALLSGRSDAYTYLPESVRKFPGAETLAEEFRAAGFGMVSFDRLTFGIVALHLARKT